MDHTATPMGSRLLRRWMHQPLRDHELLRKRQAVIAAFLGTACCESLHQHLQNIRDL